MVVSVGVVVAGEEGERSEDQEGDERNAGEY